MGKVIIVCGKICSGKSYYSNSIKDSLNAVIISPDEATYELINNEQGEFYNVFSERLNKYLTKKVGEIAQAGANVIFEIWCFLLTSLIFQENRLFVVKVNLTFLR